jgi:hypothetical protein
MPKKLPIFISNFREMIEDNYVYVDKTEHIYHLAKEKGYYFFSRPRRFGKTLLISTLKELFLGNKKLFEGLWISKSDFQWQEYPVIHLDFSSIPHLTAQELRSNINKELHNIASRFTISNITEDTPEATLKKLVEELSKKNKVVILIDEYDKPILDHLHNLEEAQKQREILKSFYGTIKGLDSYLRTVFLTGVSRFAKTSLFSGINNLNDISLKPEAAVLLGYTKEEINDYFTPHIADFVKKSGKTSQEILPELKNWYNGYQFSKQKIKVYNPFSVLYSLHDKEFQNYWFESGTPTFLINLLKKEYENIENIEEIELSAASLGSFELDNIPLIPLLLQTGYLTIKEYNENTNRFTLRLPNFEVEESFTKFIVTTLAQTSTSMVETALGQLRVALKKNDIPKFCTILESLFAHIPYTIKREDYYHSLFQFLLSLLSLEAQSEILTDKGRIDVALTTKTHVYIFELKVNNTAKVALEQIKEKRYYERFLNKNKHVVLVGLAFNRVDTVLCLEHSEEVIS